MGSPRSSFKEKVDWMIRRRELWKGWPNAPYTDSQIVASMVKDGLISELTRRNNALDFGRLVAAARDEIRKRNRT